MCIIRISSLWLIIPFNFSINCNQLSQMTNRSMLIGGVVRCRLVQLNSTGETFSHALIRGRSSTWSRWRPDEWFRQLCRSWGQFEIMLESLHRHNMVDLGIRFVTQISLLCNLQITRDSVSMVALCGRAPFTVLRTFFVTLHLPFVTLHGWFAMNLSRSTQYCYNYSALPHGSG